MTPDQAHQAHHEAVRIQIPGVLPVRVVLVNDEDAAVWIDDVRLFTQGVTLATTVVARDPPAALEGRSTVDLSGGTDQPWESGLVLDPVLITVTVDGVVLRNDDGTLCEVASRGRPGFATARWWVPRLPRHEFRIAVAWPARQLSWARALEVSSWAEAAATHVVTLACQPDS